MATMTTSPSTPKQLAVLPAAPTPPPGTWRHPRIEEIERRREASTLTRTKVVNAAFSFTLLLATFWFPGSLLRSLLAMLPLPAGFDALTLPAVRILLLLNAAKSLQPLWAPEDDMTDIPLTPTQRKLLGLAPTSKPPTPGSAYSTPPRYARSAPRSGSSRAAIMGSSPLDRSTNGSPISGSPLAGRGVGSPYGLSGLGSSPANGSPLVRKAMEQRRSSVGAMGLSQNKLESTSLFSDEASTGNAVTPGSPTLATTGRNAGVSLNSKWLYQRGKSRLGTGGSVYS